MDKYRTLEDDTFFESYLIDVQYAPWPTTIVFSLWSPRRQACYRLIAHGVLEIHYEAEYIESLDCTDVLIMSIDLATNGDQRYWSDRVAALATNAGISSKDPICLVFDSHIFSGRRHDTRLTTGDVGMLVVCQDFDVERDLNYRGPRPFPCNIPSTDE